MMKWIRKLIIWWRKRKGIYTCVKPTGTVSMLTDTSNGIHPTYSKHYKRTVK